MPLTTVQPGGVVTLWATGLGPSLPFVVTGNVTEAESRLVLPLAVKIGDQAVPADAIYYAGLAPGYVAKYVVVLKVPESLPDGDHTATLQIGNGEAETPANGFVTIKRD